MFFSPPEIFPLWSECWRTCWLPQPHCFQPPSSRIAGADASPGAVGPELPCTQTPRSAPKFPRRRPCCELRPVAAPVRRQASAARCIISNLYRALKGIQRSNWEALKLKWGWDLESTLELAVWREAWGSISSVLISGEPNINVFWRFYSSSPGVYMRVGFLFIFFFFFFSSVVVFFAL